MKRGTFFAVTILTALTTLFAGCNSSGDSNPPPETQSAQDTFRKYSGNLHDVEFRQALRNSWVGVQTSGSGESGVMARNDQQARTSFGQGILADGLLDVGKSIGEGLVKKGLSYAIDSAFGIQSKSQKQADETNFINNSLLGIQHQLTAIQNNLTDVYQNQTEQMSEQETNHSRFAHFFCTC